MNDTYNVRRMRDHLQGQFYVQRVLDTHHDDSVVIEVNRWVPLYDKWVNKRGWSVEEQNAGNGHIQVTLSPMNGVKA